MAALPAAGISIEAVTAKLVEDGVRQFADAADQLYAAVQKKRRAVLGSKLDQMSFKLPAPLDKEVAAAIEDWRREGKVRRLWAGDASLWTEADEAKWTGWLGIVDQQLKAVAQLEDFAADVRQAGFKDVLLLGMGGSSLGPEVFAKTFAQKPGYPALHVLDSTDPAQIRHVESQIDPAHTLFIVSSKSGSTLEPNIFKQYFFERAKGAVGATEAPKRFVAITDPGSSLEKAARDRRLPAHLSRVAEHRRALFGAVEFRHGAGRGDWGRSARLSGECRRDGALLRARARRRSRTPG